MKKAVKRTGILILLFVIMSVLYGCANKEVYLEGEWNFVSMIFDGTEMTKDGLEGIEWDVPTLEFTKSEFTLTTFNNPISGTWESVGDSQFTLLVNDLETFDVTMKKNNNRQTLTIRESYNLQKVVDHTMIIVFER